MSSETSKSNKGQEPESTGIELPMGTSTASDVPEGVFEDVYRFWKDHGTRLVTYLVIALVTFLGVQGWKQYASSREVSIRKEFAGLESTDAKLEFANSHKGHVLASYAFLQAAKESFETGEFKVAAQQYADASKGLKGSDVLPVAMLGQASSLRKAGDSSGAVAVLETLASNESFAEGIRAEAMFKRIVIALEDNQQDVVERFTTQLEAIDTTQLWAQRLESIKYYQ